MRWNFLALPLILFSACRVTNSSSQSVGGGSNAATRASLADSLTGIGLVQENFQSNPVNTDADAAALTDKNQYGKIILRSAAPATYARLDLVMAAIHKTLRGLGATLIPENPPLVVLLDNAEPNAFSPADGTTGTPYWVMYVQNGLLKANAFADIESDADLAAVLAHELGHALQMHAQRENFPTGIETRLRDYMDLNGIGIVKPFTDDMTSQLFLEFASRVGDKPELCPNGNAVAADAKSWVRVFGTHPEGIKKTPEYSVFSDQTSFDAMRTEYLGKAKAVFAPLAGCRLPAFRSFVQQSLRFISKDRAAAILANLTTDDVGLDDLQKIDSGLEALKATLKANTDLITKEREADEVSAVLRYHMGLKANPNLMQCADASSLTADELPKIAIFQSFADGVSFLRLKYDPHPDNCYRNALAANILRDLNTLTQTGRYPRYSDPVQNPFLQGTDGKFLAPPDDWKAMQAEISKM